MGRQLLHNQQQKDFGYEKNGYCRYVMTDRVLFDDMNRNKKSSLFKKNARTYTEEGKALSWKTLDWQEVPSLAIEKGFVPDDFDLEKYEDYCYLRRPSRFSKDFIMNDIYFYSALLYSIWTGKCFQKGNGGLETEELRKEFGSLTFDTEAVLDILAHNLGENAVYQEECDIAHLLDALCRDKVKMDKNRI